MTIDEMIGELVSSIESRFIMDIGSYGFHSAATLILARQALEDGRLADAVATLEDWWPDGGA